MRTTCDALASLTGGGGRHANGVTVLVALSVADPDRLKSVAFQVSGRGVIESVHHTNAVVRLPAEGGGTVFVTATVQVEGFEFDGRRVACSYRSEAISYPVTRGPGGGSPPTAVPVSPTPLATSAPGGGPGVGGSYVCNSSQGSFVGPCPVPEVHPRYCLVRDTLHPGSLVVEVCR